MDRFMDRQTGPNAFRFADLGLSYSEFTENYYVIVMLELLTPPGQYGRNIVFQIIIH